MGISPWEESSAFIILLHCAVDTFTAIILQGTLVHLCIFPYVRDRVALGYLIPTFGAHYGRSPKATLKMPPK
jgi:hypothetical protein